MDAKKQRPIERGDYGNEENLIAALKNGDNSAFEALQCVYGNRMLAIALSHLGIYREEAQEVVQEVLIKVFENISRFNGKSSLRTWITRITINACLDRHRKFKCRRFDRMESVEDGAALTLADSSESPSQFSERRELSRLLNEKLILLDERTRQMIIMRFYNGYESNKAAEILNLKDNTAKVKVFRGFAKLRRMILRDQRLRSYALI